jgi:transposase
MTLGRRSDQDSLFGPDPFLTRNVRKDSFYGFLASKRGEFFNDDEFAELYTQDNGRPSVPPSLLATALLLQTHDQVSDEEAKNRADFDMRWKVALGISLDKEAFAKSTLQTFRAQLVVHEKLQAIFKKSLDLARQTGYIRSHKIKAVLDTSYILGRGAVKDTYNLLGDGIIKLIKVLANLARQTPQTWVKTESSGLGLERYFDGSLKGSAGIDWEDPKARQAFLTEIVTDADRLLEVARQTLARLAVESREHKRLKETADLLGQLLLQDVERKPMKSIAAASIEVITPEVTSTEVTSTEPTSPEVISIKEGTAKDRIISVEDPEMRHGHKSATKRFNGHKAAISVDPDSQLILAVEVLPGNAPDNQGALDLVAQSEANAGVKIEETIGDCAYGDGATRQEFADAGRQLVAKVPNRPNGEYFAKTDFQIDPIALTCVCPAGETCSTLVKLAGPRGRDGKRRQMWGFRFDDERCASCPLRAKCVKSKSGQGRTVSLHPQEGLLQEARELQNSAAFLDYRRLRQVAEHRLARLMQLGMRQARYFGRAKTRAQLFLTAMVANLTLVARGVGLMRQSRPALECLPMS